MSALLPGTGQWVASRRASGAVLLAATAAMAAVASASAWAAWTGSGPDVLGWLLTRQGFTVVAIANVAVAVFRLYATVDAWDAARRRGGAAGPVQIAGLVLVLAVLLAVPHVTVAAAGMEARRVIDTVFVDDAHREARADTGRTTDPASPDDGEDQQPVGEDQQPVGEAPEPTGEEAPPLGLDSSAAVRGPALEQDPYPQGIRDRERLTVVLLGSDAGPGRSGTRVDALVVASVDVSSGEVVLISVPRNLADVPMPAGVFADRIGARYPKRLMSLYPEAAADPVLAAEFDDPGKMAHVAAVEALLGLPVDHVAMVDLAGFVDVIDAFGGVDVDVSTRIHVRLSPPRQGEAPQIYDIPSGRQRLDGHEAHAYVRSRTGTDDYDRMRRQRCLVGSLTEQASTTSLLRALPRLSGVLVERVETDIPVDLLPDLARLAGRVDVSGMRTLGLTSPDYSTGKNAHGFYSADVARIRSDVRALLDADTIPAGASDLGGTCG